MYYKFESDDLFYNTIKVHPKQEFFIYDAKVYYNKEVPVSGTFTGSVVAPAGYISLYEMNVDRDPRGHTWNTQTDPDGDGINEGSGVKTVVFPFITKAGSLTSFKTTTTSQFNNDFAYGDTITSSAYPLTASIYREYFGSGDTRAHVSALKNTFNHYKPLSRHYAYSTTFDTGWNKETQPMNLISIPSIFYGSTIKKKTVDLKFYVTGNLVGRLQDIYGNGELIQVSPTGSNGSGSVAGVVLYNEGFVCLTGSWPLDTQAAGGGNFNFLADATDLQPASWFFFGVGANDKYQTSSAEIVGETLASASYDLSFQGTNYIQTVTMLAHAKKAELNHSNNPTYVSFDSNKLRQIPLTSSIHFTEPKEVEIKNTVNSPYADPTGSFEKHTYISRIGIYDENKNLIAIANIATPVKKTEERDFTFKLKLDI